MRALSPNVEDVVRHRIRKTCERYIGAPMTEEVLDAMRQEIVRLVDTYVSYGEVQPVPHDEIIVFVDPVDRSRLLVKVGKDENCHDPFCDTMPWEGN